MSHFKPNLRDLEFTLFDVLGRDEIMGSGPYADLDLDTAREMLREMARLAVEDLAPSLMDSDRNPPIFDPVTHTVRLPEAFKRSYQAYLDAGFWQADIAPEHGGTVIPPSLRWALAEMVLGANPAVHMYSSGFAFSAILNSLGTPEQKKLAQLMAERHWGATMVLTEADAGSDVGAGRTRAVEQEDGTWAIEGVKRFISSAEADIYENVVHLVLARPVGHGPGTKGLSLFAVPTHHVDLSSGVLGERNGVFVTNVEHKMGLKASTTCELRFGEVEGIPAIGTLVGGVHNGIAQMFRVIEMARMMVGSKAIATLSTGYLNALDYAKLRVQGPDLTRAGDASAPRVPITHHADVRRSLMTQKSYAEGLRALVLYTATFQDAAALAKASGTPDEISARVNDLLLPIVKAVGSERSWVLLGTESLQTFGGSGFLQDYPVEQYVRDAKIDTLYEGTTAIQGLDFFFRKIVRDRGTALAWLAGQINDFVKSDAGDGRLAAERELLGTGLEEVQSLVGYLVGTLMAAQGEAAGAAGGSSTGQSSTQANGESSALIHRVGQNTTRLLMAAGDLIIGWLLLRSAEVALTRLDQLDAATTSPGVSAAPIPVVEADRHFFEGKVASARFFARQVLPRLAVERAIAESTDDSLMTLDERAF